MTADVLARNGMELCKMCLKEMDLRPEGKGDHVLPHSLGQFSPNLMVRNICIGCDNKYGRKLEKYLASHSLNGFQRYQLQIEGYNGTYSPHNDPEFHRDQYLTLHLIGSHGPMIAQDNGILRVPDFIEFTHKGETRAHYQPDMLPALTIADRIEDLSFRKKSYKLLIALNDKKKYELLSHIMMTRLTRNCPLESTTLPMKEPVTFNLEAAFDHRYIRASTYGVLKLMILQGVDIQLLSEFKRFIHYPEYPPGRGRISFPHWLMAKPMGSDPINLFSHRYEWRISDKFIEIIAGYFLTWKSGILMKLSLPIGQSNSVSPSNGSAIFEFGTKGSRVFLGSEEMTRKYQMQN